MSEFLLHPHIHATPRAELWRADADAGAVAQLIGAVERIDQRDTRIQLADARQVERVRQIEIELEVTRQGFGVGEAAAQAGTVEEIAADTGCIADGVAHAS